MDTLQERKFRRFNLEYLVHLRFPSGDAMAEVDALTKNIGLGGLLVESACLIPDRSPVEFTITVRGVPILRPVKLTGAGEVVRIEPARGEAGFGIAVKCTTPIGQIDHHWQA